MEPEEDVNLELLIGSCGRVEFERTTDFFTFVPNNWNGMKIALGDCTKQKKAPQAKKIRFDSAMKWILLWKLTRIPGMG